MRVTRLEVFGFKSFMDRMVLPVNAGMTGVVGPNGCGKSNIVDALRWVLGETRAKSLRGAIAEDVIFNGTEKLRPLGLAEVSITLAAQNKNFFEDLVSPRSETDSIIQSVAMESGIEEDADLGAHEGEEESKNEAVGEDKLEKPKHKFTVIDGGISVDGEKKQADEVAAPEVTSQTVAKSADETSEENKNRSLSFADKFSWLKSTNEVQITRRLYRSGESEYFINRVPCRLKDIVDLFRAVGMGARAYNIVAQGEISRIVTAKPEDKRTILEEAAGVLGFRDRIAATNRRLKETEINIARIDDIVKEVSRNVASLKRQAAKAKSRESLKARVVELEQALFTDRYIRFTSSFGTFRSQLENGRNRESTLEAALTKVQAEEQEVRGKLMGVDVESDAIRSKIDSVREELNRRERERQLKRSKLQELVILTAATETEIKRLKEREVTLNERKTLCEQTIETLKKTEVEVTNEISGIETGSQDDLKTAAKELDLAREAVRTLEQELRFNREKLVADESRLNALNEQLKAASPATKLKETLGEEGREYLSRSHGLLVDGIKVPEQYAKAIQAVLAEKASFLVSEDVLGLSRTFIANALRNNAANNKKGLALGIFKAGTSSQEPALKSFAEGDVTAALDIVTISGKHELAAKSILSNVYCATTLEGAQKFLDRISSMELQAEPVVVTAEGDIVTRYSFYSFRHEGGLVQLKNHILRLEESSAGFRAKVTELNKKREELISNVSKAQSYHEKILRESEQRARLVKELSQKLGSARGRLQAEQRLGEQIKQDLERALRQAQDAQTKIQKLQQDQEAVKAQMIEEETEEEKALKQELSEMAQKSSVIEAQRREGRNELSKFSQRVADARTQLDQARAETSRVTLALQKAELEVSHLKDTILEHLGADVLQGILEIPENLRDEKLIPESQSAEYQDEVSKIKTRMVREGEVDPTSIARCEEEEKRLEELEAQKVDLEQAYRTLQRTVVKLTDISQERFIKTFEAVNTNFSQLIPKIFGGGSAKLELTDPSNPLESGVEIIARPPGKKLKSIELLSGGEKTLCAISLIIAMFLERPSPVCVLDEVDAPLDEANVVRFLTIIKEMSNKTQFVLITHNKQSMSACDHLVGVTMEQPGASKIVTVSLEEAYSHAVND